MNGDDKLMEFLYACPVGLIDFDRAGRIGVVNPRAMKYLMPLAGGANPENLFEALERHAPELRSIVGAFTPTHGEIRDGHRIYVDLGERRRKGRPHVLSCSIVRLGADRFMATLSDISAQVAQEQRLNQADAWFSALIDGINDYALLVLSGDGTILRVNRSFTRQTGHADDAVIGRHVKEILSAPSSDGGPLVSLEDEFAAAMRDGWTLREGWELRSNGERYWCQRLIVARDDEENLDSPAFSMVLRDVPPRSQDGIDLVAMLTQDHLTGAANRMRFQKALQREGLAWRKLRQPAALVMLDLDHFKALNDEHGHPVGDDVLREVARVGLAVADQRSVFARLGGEEFALLLPRADLRTAGRVAEELREAIAALRVGAAEVRITASLGCAELDEVDGSTDGLIELADARLYDAKRAGRDRVLSPAT